ncbi:MAG: cupin domain-containing protein [Clostridia bacterium]|nr:cupin domain-containing protein [Clostridia bacterium]
MTAQEIKRIFNLIPLEKEGGFYQKTYKSAKILPRGVVDGETTERTACGAIYFLMEASSNNRLHRNKSDEIYNFYLGDTLLFTMLHPDGRAETVRLGTDYANGEVSQLVVPGGSWQGSRLAPGGSFAFMGTMMAPEYDDEDYIDIEDLPNGADTLKEQYPDFADEIERLSFKAF